MGRPLLCAEDCSSSFSRPTLTYSRRFDSEARALEMKGTLLAVVTGGGGGGVDGGGEGEAEKYD